MQQWEYLVIWTGDGYDASLSSVTHINGEDAERRRLNPKGKTERYWPALWDVLNELGTQGWEAISQGPFYTGGEGAIRGHLFLCKRPIPEPT